MATRSLYSRRKSISMIGRKLWRQARIMCILSRCAPISSPEPAILLASAKITVLVLIKRITSSGDKIGSPSISYPESTVSSVSGGRGQVRLWRNKYLIFWLAVRVTRMGAEVTGMPDFWYSKFHSPRVPPGDDQPLTEETVDSVYQIGSSSTSRASYFTFHGCGCEIATNRTSWYILQNIFFSKEFNINTAPFKQLMRITKIISEPVGHDVPQERMINYLDQWSILTTKIKEIYNIQYGEPYWLKRWENRTIQHYRSENIKKPLFFYKAFMFTTWIVNRLSFYDPWWQIVVFY